MSVRVTKESFCLKEKGGIWMKDYKSDWWFHIHSYRIPDGRMEYLEDRGFSLEALYATLSDDSKTRYWNEHGINNETLKSLVHLVTDDECESCKSKLPPSLEELAQLQKIGLARENES